MSRDRTAFVSKIRHPIRRAIYTTAHEAITRSPEISEKALGAKRKTSEMEYVGMGGECTVLRRDVRDVLKVVHRSVLLKPIAKEALAEHMTAEYRTIAGKLGQFVLPQSYIIEAHPLLENHAALGIVQPYRKIRSPALFFKSPVETAQTIRELETVQPNATEQITEFMRKSQELYEESNLLPDINNSDNLGFDSVGNLLLIDPQLQGPEWPDRQRRIQSGFEGLETALAIAA